MIDVRTWGIVENEKCTILLKFETELSFQTWRQDVDIVNKKKTCPIMDIAGCRVKIKVGDIPNIFQGTEGIVRSEDDNFTHFKRLGEFGNPIKKTI